MIAAIYRAFAQLADPAVQRVLGGCVLLAVGCFVALWFGVGWLLATTTLLQWQWLERALDVLGGFATLILTWLLLPLLVGTFVGLFLEPIAAAVERRHYPSLGKAPGVPLLAGLWCSVRYLGLVVVVNVLLLALLVFPPVYALAYYVGNGVLLGREYFDLVALRRTAPAAVRGLRRAHRFELLALGGLGAFAATVPLLNLVAPVVLTATMVHRHEAWRQAGGG